MCLDLSDYKRKENFYQQRIKNFQFCVIPSCDGDFSLLVAKYMLEMAFKGLAPKEI